MSTIRSTGPWRKNVFTPRSRLEAFGSSEFLPPAEEENFTFGEILVSAGGASLLFVLILTGVV